MGDGKMDQGTDKQIGSVAGVDCCGADKLLLLRILRKFILVLIKGVRKHRAAQFVTQKQKGKHPNVRQGS